MIMDAKNVAINTSSLQQTIKFLNNKHHFYMLQLIDSQKVTEQRRTRLRGHYVCIKVEHAGLCYWQISKLCAGFPLYFGGEIQGLFKDPKIALSSTNSRWKFTAWTVLQRYLISVSVITGQFYLLKTKHNNY